LPECVDRECQEYGNKKAIHLFMTPVESASHADCAVLLCLKFANCIF